MCSLGHTNRHLVLQLSFQSQITFCLSFIITYKLPFSSSWLILLKEQTFCELKCRVYCSLCGALTTLCTKRWLMQFLLGLCLLILCQQWLFECCTLTYILLQACFLFVNLQTLFSDMNTQRAMFCCPSFSGFVFMLFPLRYLLPETLSVVMKCLL